ncbi:esterase YqiA [Neiella sp. HB171785]|uniref:Esterase YqiA n=1 Tax=Neiella litorisoli TaxID=2771431 RepID=A0A8J6R2N5_9GAMM|nr:YqiA/YcfP family alpha/beta fold hydrolase [Neiella litorisoli]MBD1389080.1 esterase YqiA [Neiella litorisoli]
MQQTLFYIHGFMSSEQSHKAQLTGQYLSQHLPQVRYLTPRLADEPNIAIEQLAKLVAQAKLESQVALIGSSLGGFYGHHLSERFGVRAVLINPAVAPYVLLQDYLGPQTNPYTGNAITITLQHMAQLRAIEHPVNNAQLLQVWLETGDEVLDYRQAEQYFHNCDCRIRSGGDHSYQHFAEDLPNMLKFLLA